MRGPYNLYFYLNTTYAWPSELHVHACVRMRMCACVRLCTYVRVCACAYVYVYAHTCVRALRTCVRVYTYVCVVYLCLCMCVRAYVCMCAYMCACGCVCAYVVRACAWEGIEDALPLGVLPHQERASLPICMSTLGALRCGLGAFSSLSPFILKSNWLIPVRASQGPCHLII